MWCCKLLCVMLSGAVSVLCDMLWEPLSVVMCVVVCEVVCGVVCGKFWKSWDGRVTVPGNGECPGTVPEDIRYAFMCSFGR